MSKEIYSKAKFISELNKVMESASLERFRHTSVMEDGTHVVLKPTEVRSFLFAYFMNRQLGASFNIYTSDLLKGRIRSLHCIDHAMKFKGDSEAVAMYEVLKDSFYPHDFDELCREWKTFYEENDPLLGLNDLYEN